MARWRNIKKLKKIGMFPELPGLFPKNESGVESDKKAENASK